MDQSKAPLLERLLEHRNRHHTSGHVPGHKSGKGLPDQASVLREVMSIDFTEITGLDDLHEPEGAIRDAQRLAAACFGAEETFFLINGSTVGNLAAILTLCGRGDILIVQRDVHKSVLNGLSLAGAKAVFVPPRIDLSTSLAAGICPEKLGEALRLYPEAKGVFLTNPNYYGLGIDLKQIVALVHAAGLPVVIDEAHGAHYGFHSDLPVSALYCGADLVVQSTHKMLTALTMGAMLHVQGTSIDRDLLKQRLSMLQSSSPSYPIMASLDASRLLLASEGKERLDEALRTVNEAYSRIGEMPCFRVVEWMPDSVFATKDPFKIVVTDVTGTLGGFKLRDELEARGLMTEMADARNVLIVFSIASNREDAGRLVRALTDIDVTFGLSSSIPGSVPLSRENGAKGPVMYDSSLSEPVSFDLDKRHSTISLEIEQSAGCRSGEMVIPYPPGVPLLYKGERISNTTAAYLAELVRTGACRFHGAADPTMRTIQVIQEKKQETADSVSNG